MPKQSFASNIKQRINELDSCYKDLNSLLFSLTANDLALSLCSDDCPEEIGIRNAKRHINTAKEQLSALIKS